MNKLLLCCLMSVTLITVGCSMSDTRPSHEYNQHLKNIELDVHRVDRGAVHAEIKNNLDKPVTIDWERSTINNQKVVMDMTRDIKNPIENTILPPHQKLSVTLYQSDNIFYRDPVLYQPGGYQTKEIKYPAVVSIMIDNVANSKDVHFNGR